MAVVQESESTSCICSEEDLQRAIELGKWYNSEEEDSNSDSDPEDTDSGSRQNSFSQIKTRWSLFWSTDQNVDDPAFLKGEASVPRGCSIIVEELLNQVIEEGIDLGGGNCLQVLKDDSAKDDTGAAGTTQNGVDERVSSLVGVAVLAGFDEGTSVDPERPRYYYIAKEMMTSERTYVQSLRLLEKVVHGAVKTAHRTNRSVLPENGRKEIFLNIGELYALTFDLLQELEERIENWDANAVVADVIAKRAPFFKLYSMYSERFGDAQVAYSKWLKSSKQFAQLIKMIESGPLCKGLPVSSHMLCPIQRIPRYKLLLEDYLKHLPEGHPDVVNAEAALAAISEAATHMNSRITDLESQAVVMKIQQCFAGKDNLVSPGRKYIGRGLVDFIPGGKRRQRILFLFSDILLIAASATLGKYKIRHKIPLKNLVINTLEPSSSLKNGFCIAAMGTNKLFRFCTKSQEERKRWMTKLKRAKIANSDHFTINESSKYAAVLNDPEAHNSIRAVLNDPSFEHSQPSWVRRSQRNRYHSATLPVRLAFATEKATRSPIISSPYGLEEVDQGVNGEEQEEIVTEFEEEDNGVSAMSLKPGVDNSLSSYMNQRSAKGDVWQIRWFVLTSQALVCYENHLHDEAVGAIPLAGYSLSLPTVADGIKRHNVLKLTHSKFRTYLFQLPSSYDFERWCAMLNELLGSTVNLAC